MTKPSVSAGCAGATRAGASLALCAVLLTAGPVYGHAKLITATPGAGAQIAGSPRSLTLTFNEEVRLGVLKLSTAGHAVPLPIDAHAAPTRTITVVLPPLAAGSYEVRWSALTPSDGHVVKGAYSFVIR